jgi:hypothetical protein
MALATQHGAVVECRFTAKAVWLNVVKFWKTNYPKATTFTVRFIVNEAPLIGVPFDSFGEFTPHCFSRGLGESHTCVHLPTEPLWLRKFPQIVQGGDCAHSPL